MDYRDRGVGRRLSDRLRLFALRLAAAQGIAIFFTLVVGIPIVGYSAWFWHHHVDWISTLATVSDCAYREISQDAVDWACVYRFNTSEGAQVKAQGTWREDSHAQMGQPRTILYNPAQPTQIIASKTAKLTLSLWITLALHVGISLFWGLFIFREKPASPAE